jgi:hypothetical protein
MNSQTLLSHLEKLTEKVRSDQIPFHVFQDIYDSIEEYVEEKEGNLSSSETESDVKAITYLFRGWWLTQAIEKASLPLENGMRCPCCFQSLPEESSVSKENEKE